MIQSFTALHLVVFTNPENVGSPDLALRTEPYKEGELGSFCGMIYTFYVFVLCTTKKILPNGGDNGEGVS